MGAKYDTTDAALQRLAGKFKAAGGCLTRAAARDSLAEFSRPVRLAALGQIEIVCDVEWVGRHGHRPMPGDKFYLPKRRRA